MKSVGNAAPTISVLMTSFNRREKTLGCLKGLFAQEGLTSEFSVRVTLVDASSPDGTAAAVNEFLPDVNVIEASSNVYWGEGMRDGCGGLRRRQSRLPTLAK